MSSLERLLAAVLVRFGAACPICHNPVPAGQVMCSTCARKCAGGVR